MEDFQPSFRGHEPHQRPSAEISDTVSDAGGVVGAGKRFMQSFSWDHFARILFYGMAALLPLWALPITIFPVELNKAFLFAFLTLLAFIAWLVGRIQEGEFLLPKHFLALALVLLVIVSLISGLFSVSSHMSFIGLGHESGSVVSLFLFVLAAMLASFLFQGHNHVRTLLVVFAASSLILFLLQMIHIFAGISPWSSLGQAPSQNPFGSWNAFGLYWSFLGFLFLFLAKSTHGIYMRSLFSAVVAAAVIMMIAVNFTLAWILFTVFSIILFAYLYSFRRFQKGLHWEPLAVLLISLFFLVTPVLGQSVSDLFGGNVLEIRPSWEATWSVAQQTVTGEHLVLGSGPNTFLYNWLQNKPPEINQTAFWATRFNSGVSFIPTLFATLGLAGGIVLLFFIGAFFFYGVRAVFRYALSHDQNNPFAVAFFLGTIYLLLTLLFYTPGYSLVFFFFLFLGLFMAQASKEGVMPHLRIPLFQNAGVGFVSALLLLFLSVGSIAGVYLLGQKYVAAVIYGEGIQLFNQDGNIEEARGKFARAVNLDERDRYLRSLAETDLVRMNALLSRTDIPADELRQRFQLLLAQAVQSGQQAADINSVDPLNWTTLGQVYEAVIPFNIQGASDFASTMYARAQETNPRNPEALFFEARVRVQTGDLDAARTLLRQANEIKTDYAPARFLLAQLEAQAGNIRDAIEEARNAQFLIPNDIGVLFQLGLLYYQDNQFENARQVFERTVELNENYSNARYFLGLIYDRQGEPNVAMRHFERIKELNPDNNEVQIILDNLQNERPALEGITPPPENREAPPLEEEQSQ